MVALAIADAEAPGKRVPAIPQPGKLTDREWEIAYLAGAGLSAEQIARQLFLSTAAVEEHLASVFGKLGVASADQLGPWLEEAAGPPARAVPELGGGQAGVPRGCRGAPARARSPRTGPGSCPCRSRASHGAR